MRQCFIVPIQYVGINVSPTPGSMSQVLISDVSLLLVLIVLAYGASILGATWLLMVRNIYHVAYNE